MAKKTQTTRTYVDRQGIPWTVAVELPGSSNAMIVFHRAGAPNSRDDRYAWYQASTPEARSVTSHLDAGAILESLDEQSVALLFRRSMRISVASDPLGLPVAAPAA